MSFKWLKRYMPRGLYQRAALILILPVVVVQLVVSVVFAQRHFTEVTAQMTDAMIGDLTLVFKRIAQAPDADGVPAALADLAALEIDVEMGAEIPPRDTRLWYDFTGTVFGPRLQAAFPQIERLLLADDTVVELFAQTQNGPAKISFDRRRISATAPHQLYVNMIFFGVLTTVIAYIYLRNQLRPITRLAEAAEAFGRGRHLPYTAGGAAEVRAAGTAFIDMRNRIERHIEQRTLMLSGVSHDLRTPLTRMKLALSFLEKEDREPLEHDVEEMQRLVDEFLSFVKGASEGMPEEVDPIALVQGVIEDAQRAGRNVVLAEARGQGVISLRETAIRRALDNLVSNGVRYGKRAEVSVVMSEKSLRIRVEDDGPGIPEKMRAEAQKPFVRLDPSRNQDRGAGVGLGLAIATDVARSHGGVLRLSESERLGGLCADIVIAR
ncbi:HAMP domain-containing protein [Aliishimia ponticola]|uniref:histidine kinase n=1 Tax=Aliishimia ponticola TaxID=2499833 RepID=A0A4V3XKX1_9RHOB|nr:ATP-binding protein [Aliishimia ponticola]THH38613.1 HAMP domain-containing protein [Aliishimia ponticola]